MDDIKISHVDEQVISHFIKWLKKINECIFEDESRIMKVSCGKLHDYLGMQLDFSMQGQVSVTMNSYIQAMLDKLYKHDPTKTTAKTLVMEHLFQVYDKASPLSEKGATVFHTFLAKALFLTKQACPDIAMAVAFLTTCVMHTDQDDWRKLHQMM